MQYSKCVTAFSNKPWTKQWRFLQVVLVQALRIGYLPVIKLDWFQQIQVGFSPQP